jgi:oligopeptide transport system permease protein
MRRARRRCRWAATGSGRDVLAKAIKGTEISVFVGVMAAVTATLIGTLLGALSGFFGGKVGDFLEWLYNVFEAIPGILLIFAFAAVFGRGIGTVVLILGLTGWTGLYRQVRAEFMKHRSREYVRAAEAIGASSPRACSATSCPTSAT